MLERLGLLPPSCSCAKDTELLAGKCSLVSDTVLLSPESDTLSELFLHMSQLAGQQGHSCADCMHVQHQGR